MKLTIETKEHVYAFHQEFISGTEREFEYMMTSGAGCGNPYIGLKLKNTKTGETIWETIDATELFQTWIETKIKSIEAKIVTDK